MESHLWWEVSDTGCLGQCDSFLRLVIRNDQNDRDSPPTFIDLTNPSPPKWGFRHFMWEEVNAYPSDDFLISPSMLNHPVWPGIFLPLNYRWEDDSDSWDDTVEISSGDEDYADDFRIPPVKIGRDANGWKVDFLMHHRLPRTTCTTTPI